MDTFLIQHFFSSVDCCEKPNKITFLIYFFVGFDCDDSLFFNLYLYYFPLCRFFRHYLLCVSVHNMAVALFRLVGAIGRTQVVSNILAGMAYQIIFVLGGFIVSRGKIHHFNFHHLGIL